MEIKFTETKLEGKTIRTTASISIALEEFEGQSSSNYQQKQFIEKVQDAVITEIAGLYLDAKRDDILKAIDLDQVTKGVQFKVINEFAGHGNVGG